jgi:hypothetical protein
MIVTGAEERVLGFIAGGRRRLRFDVVTIRWRRNSF